MVAIFKNALCRCSNCTFFTSLCVSYITTPTVEMQFVQRLLLLFRKLLKRNISTSKRKIKLMVINALTLIKNSLSVVRCAPFSWLPFYLQNSLRYN